MPQKRNPDAAELVRAKTGRIVGALDAMLIVMKGLPLAYQKDMQEDKEGAMDALSALSLSLVAMTGMVRDMEPDEGRMRAAAGEGYATATDLADWLVRTLNMPFREAHHITGRIVAAAAAERSRSTACRSTAMRKIEPRISRRRVTRCCRSSARSRAGPALAVPRPRTCARRRRNGSPGWRRPSAKQRINCRSAFLSTPALFVSRISGIAL